MQSYTSNTDRSANLATYQSVPVWEQCPEATRREASQQDARRSSTPLQTVQKHEKLQLLLMRNGPVHKAGSSYIAVHGIVFYTYENNEDQRHACMPALPMFCKRLAAKSDLRSLNAYLIAQKQPLATQVSGS